jgi:hypothetical protein
MHSDTIVICATHASSLKDVSISRLIATAFALERLADRVDVDAESSELARRPLIVSHRREQIADTELGSTVVQGAAGGSLEHPTDDRGRGDDPRLGPGRLRDRRACLRQQGRDRVADRGLVGAEAHEHLHRDAVTVVSQTEKKMPGSDVWVPQRQRFAQRQLQHLLGPRRERDHRPGALSTQRHDLHHPFTCSIGRHPQRAQRPTGIAVGVGEQAQQLMLGLDTSVPELSGYFLRIDHHLAGGLCEPFEHEPQASHRAERLARHTVRTDHSCQTRGLAWIPPFGTRLSCRCPVSPTGDRTLQGRFALFPFAHGLGSASGRRPAFRAHVNHRIPTRRNPR